MTVLARVMVLPMCESKKDAATQISYDPHLISSAATVIPSILILETLFTQLQYFYTVLLNEVHSVTNQRSLPKRQGLGLMSNKVDRKGMFTWEHNELQCCALGTMWGVYKIIKEFETWARLIGGTATTETFTYLFGLTLGECIIRQSATSVTAA